MTIFIHTGSAAGEFPDNESYLKYGQGMDKEAWRRSNVDSIILLLNHTIREVRKTCKFGISPFGVWRNQTRDSLGSDTHAGQTNYDDLYADILLWLKNGWIDYVVPQLYWEFEYKNAPFGVLIDWWNQHHYDRPCYIGLGYFTCRIQPDTGEMSTSFPGNCGPFAIFRILAGKYISAALRFSEIHMDGMIPCATIFIIIRP